MAEEAFDAAEAFGKVEVLQLAAEGEGLFRRAIQFGNEDATDFCRISDRLAKEIVERSGLKETAKTTQLDLDQYKALLGAMQSAKYLPPPTDCLSPIGEALIRKGLKNVLDDMRPEFYSPPVTRSPRVYSGNPFQVEVGIVYGGNIPADQQVSILRFANRVPLLYQQGACVLTKSVESVDWRRYGLEQRGGSGIPFGPAIILVHLASTKVPFKALGEPSSRSTRGTFCLLVRKT